jgi:hypothetical protein
MRSVRMGFAYPNPSPANKTAIATQIKNVKMASALLRELAAKTPIAQVVRSVYMAFVRHLHPKLASPMSNAKPTKDVSMACVPSHAHKITNAIQA